LNLIDEDVYLALNNAQGQKSRSALLPKVISYHVTRTWNDFYP